MSDFISAGTIAALLEARSDAVSLSASAIAAALDPDHPLRLGVQPAARTAATLKTKYTLARQQGIDVRGLEDLVVRLTALADAPIRVCVAEGSGEFSLVVLNDEMTRVEAVLHVIEVGGAG